MPHHSLGFFLMGNNKLVLDFLGRSSEYCLSQPLKIFDDFAAPIFTCLECVFAVYVDSLFFWWANRKRNAVSDLAVLSPWSWFMDAGFPLISHLCLISVQAFWSPCKHLIPQFYCWEECPGSNGLGMVFSW